MWRGICCASQALVGHCPRANFQQGSWHRRPRPSYAGECAYEQLRGWIGGAVVGVGEGTHRRPQLLDRKPAVRHIVCGTRRRADPMKPATAAVTSDPRRLSHLSVIPRIGAEKAA